MEIRGRMSDSGVLRRLIKVPHSGDYLLENDYQRVICVRENCLPIHRSFYKGPILFFSLLQSLLKYKC